MSLGELLQEVTEHTARNLIAQRVDIDAEELRAQKSVRNVLLADLGEVLCNLRELFDIKSRVIRRSL